MKKLCFLILFSFIFKINQGQNLVPNGDFENYTSCPGALGLIINAAPWVNPSLASPDYFNSCATVSTVDVPQNVLGYQQPHSGNGYVGIFVFTQPPLIFNYREYIEVQLATPLVANSCYHFEMYVNTADESKFAVEELNIYFSNAVLTGYPVNQLPFIPQMTNTAGFISDTLAWNLISGEYYAVGGESYLTIGNYKDNASTNFITIDSTAQYAGAYYYIDDVSLILNPCSGIEDVNSKDAISVFPNPVKNVLNVATNNQVPSEIKLYDATGKIYLQQQFVNAATINTEHLEQGIYFYEIKFNDGGTKHGKVIKD